MNNTYWWGLVIVSICIGSYTANIFGWLTFGIGLILYASVTGLVNYLDKRKGLKHGANFEKTGE